MDVHKDSITLAVLPTAARNPTRLERLPNDSPRLKRFLDRIARDGELRVCYEACDGYVLHGRCASRAMPATPSRRC